MKSNTRKKRRTVALALLAVTGGVALALVAAPYAASRREARYARMSLDEQIQTQETHQNDSLFLLALGRKLNERQRFSEAAPLLERAAGLDPDSASIRDTWTQALLGSGRVSFAFGMLRQFQGTHPQSGEAPFLLAKFYVTQQNLQPALVALEETTRRDPNHAEAWSLLAHTRIKMGNDMVGAQEALERALKLRPNAAKDHLQLGTLLAASAPERARRELATAVGLSPRDAVGHREYGRFLLEAHDVKSAEPEARRAAELDGNDPLAQWIWGRCLVAQNRLGEAVPVLERAASLAPSETAPADELRRAYRQMGDNTSAKLWDGRYLARYRGAEERRRLKDATSANNSSRDAHHRYAAALARIGDINGCARQEAFALKLPPDNPRVLTATARNLDEGGYHREALSLLRQAETSGRLNPDTRETLGMALMHLGRLHEAGVVFESIRDWRADKRTEYARKIQETARKLAASDAPSERSYRQAQQTADPNQAEALLNQTLAAAPDNTRALRTLMRLQFGQGRSDAAQNTAERLLFLSPEDGTAHALLALLLIQAEGERPPSAEMGPIIEAHLEAARGDATATASACYARGLLALHRGQARDAVTQFERAAQRDPNGLAVYRRLAEARTAMGDTAGARRAEAEFARRSQKSPVTPASTLSQAQR